MLKTKVDELCELLVNEKNNSLELDALSKSLNVPALTIEKISKALESKGIVEVLYPLNMLSKSIIKLRQKLEGEELSAIKGKEISSYSIASGDVKFNVSIVDVKNETQPIYQISLPTLGPYTSAYLDYIKTELARQLPIESEELLDPRKSSQIKDRFFKAAYEKISELPDLDKKDRDMLTTILIQKMYGLGNLDILMNDDMLEEISLNSSQQPVSIYHRKFGWLKTNLTVQDEEEVYNYATSIGRKSGREITLLEPIMDTHLASGDRVAATLFPISTFGNTITIRRFARDPWSLVDFIDPKIHTLSTDAAALLWLSVQYELNILVAGGTASGKTSMLNTLCALMPPSSRTITIEDTRELTLPSYLKWNWVSLLTRNPNPEGKGGISMLELMLSSLRMRPDRVIVGEVRRRREAEVLFEAMHTGHAVYSTIHADTASQVIRRLTSPPFLLPPSELQALHMVLVMYRDRRKGLRRMLEISEVSSGGETLSLNTIYRWHARNDEFEKLNEGSRLMEELNLHTGMNIQEIQKDLNDKKQILDWLLKNNTRNMETIGKVMSLYYKDPQLISEAARKNTPADKV
ncbi:type II/IV secretion system ATPase subunit [Candidatus Micrarchaeota archaeon]|nr:type II/IV secretion system ATPase subunit [Candidatus Micrarchaeota archaeon]